MTPPFMPLKFPQDPSNRHYDDRWTWLAWRDPEPAHTPARQRLGRTLVRLGRWLEGIRPAPPALDTTRTRRPATQEIAP